MRENYRDYLMDYERALYRILRAPAVEPDGLIHEREEWMDPEDVKMLPVGLDCSRTSAESVRDALQWLTRPLEYSRMTESAADMVVALHDDGADAFIDDVVSWFDGLVRRTPANMKGFGDGYRIEAWRNRRWLVPARFEENLRVVARLRPTVYKLARSYFCGRYIVLRGARPPAWYLKNAHSP